MIVNSEGQFIRSTIGQNAEAVLNAQQISDLAKKARSTIRDLDPLVRPSAHPERPHLPPHPVEEPRNHGGPG